MKYSGGCHCVNVRYEVDFELENVISCNCSICEKKGTLLAFAPASQFKLLKGQDQQNDYQFAKKMIHHLFCKTCGVTSFAEGAMPDGTQMSAINVRCLDGVDLETLQITKVDGKSF